LKLTNDWQNRLLAQPKLLKVLDRTESERALIRLRIKRAVELYLSGDIDRERYA